MNNINEDIICGRCGTSFKGYQCPSCGLVMCKDIINNEDIKLRLFNGAVKQLMDFKLIPDGVKLNDAYADFYYLLQSLDKEDGDIIGAFKIVAPNQEYFFNFNKTLQCLKPENKEMYEREFNEVRRIHRINDTSNNNPAYKVAVQELKNFAPPAGCKKCGKEVNPYDIVCKNCGCFLAEDFPNDFKEYTVKIGLDNYVTGLKGQYLVTFKMPVNVDLTEGDTSEYLTFVNNKGPSFISYKIMMDRFLDPSKLEQFKNELYLGKEVRSGYSSFEDGSYIYIAEIRLNDDMFAKMEYQIKGVTSISGYDENEFKKYLAPLIFAQISGEGYEQTNQSKDMYVPTNSNTSDNYLPNNDTPQKKSNIGLIIGIVVGVVVLVAAVVVLLVIVKPFEKATEYTFKDKVILTIPRGFKPESELKEYDSLEEAYITFKKGNCTIDLAKQKQLQLYDFNTHGYIDTFYTKENIYRNNSDPTEKIINGKTWYFNDDYTSKEYTYIDENNPKFRYKVEFYSFKDECNFDESLNSLTIK